MICNRCERPLILRAESNSKLEVWGCNKRGCGGKEVVVLWGERRDFPNEEQAGNRDHLVFLDKQGLACWEYDDKRKCGIIRRIG